MNKLIPLALLTLTALPASAELGRGWYDDIIAPVFYQFLTDSFSSGHAPRAAGQVGAFADGARTVGFALDLAAGRAGVTIVDDKGELARVTLLRQENTLGADLLFRRDGVGYIAFYDCGAGATLDCAWVDTGGLSLPSTGASAVRAHAFASGDELDAEQEGTRFRERAIYDDRVELDRALTDQLTESLVIDISDEGMPPGGRTIPVRFGGRVLGIYEGYCLPHA